MEKVGMVGVGVMGSAMLERLQLVDEQTIVYDSDPSKLETAHTLGAKVALSAAEVAQAAAIIDVVVRTDQDVLDCMMGRDGILEGAQPGTLILLCGTILPQTTHKAAEVVRQHSVDVIDTCMTAAPRIVREGNLSFFVGGPVEFVERARPHLLQMGKQVLHMGPLGSDNVAKLIKNLVSGAETLVIQEAIQIGKVGGIPYPDLLEMMRKLYSATVLTRLGRVPHPVLA